MIQAIADRGFNIIRVPFSVQILLEYKKGIESEIPHVNHAYNKELDGMNGIQIFDFFMQQCRVNGLKIFIDIHCVKTDQMGHMYALWYNDQYSTDQFYEAIQWIVDRYKDDDVLIGVDVKNEPHGKSSDELRAIWNDGTAKNNWKYVAETAGNKIHAVNPNLLILVEGIEIFPKDDSNSDFHIIDSTGQNTVSAYHFAWWGGNLRGVAKFPVKPTKPNKVVYSPHDYGPGVYQNQPWFHQNGGGFTYDSLIKDYWYDTWLYIHDKKIAPLLIGEWGGRLEGQNTVWIKALAKLIQTYGLHQTFWSFNPNSGDTGGLVKDDWVTWDEEKYAIVKPTLWQRGGKFVGLSSTVPLGKNGISRNG
jgi:aryl-phospho-beta-D-glucosidase BglC (GH1 family)